MKRSTKLTNLQSDGLRKKKTHIIKKRNENGDIIDSTEIRIIGKYYEQLYANKLYNLDEMDKLLET